MRRGYPFGYLRGGSLIMPIGGKGEGYPPGSKKDGYPPALMKRGISLMAGVGGYPHSRLGGGATLIPCVGVPLKVPWAGVPPLAPWGCMRALPYVYKLSLPLLYMLTSTLTPGYEKIGTVGCAVSGCRRVRSRPGWVNQNGGIHPVYRGRRYGIPGNVAGEFDLRKKAVGREGNFRS